MFDLFYIVEVNPNWFNLCVTTNYFCVGCGSDINKLLDTVRKYVKKYKTREKILKVLSNLDSHGKHCNAQTEEHYKNIHDSAKYLYLEEISAVISETLIESKEDSQFNRIRNKLKKVEVVKEKTNLVPVKTVAENNKVIKRPLIRKPVLINIK